MSIFFMYLQTASRFIGMNCLSGFSFCILYRIPVSVATTNCRASDDRACFIMPSVESMCPLFARSPLDMWYMVDDVQLHSGWTKKSAFLKLASIWLMSSAFMPAWTWHSPGQMNMFFLFVTSATYEPRNRSGRKRTSLSAGMLETTLTAVEE